MRDHRDTERDGQRTQQPVFRPDLRVAEKPGGFFALRARDRLQADAEVALALAGLRFLAQARAREQLVILRLEQVRGFYEAAFEFYRAAPWRRVPGDRCSSPDSGSVRSPRGARCTTASP